jgi:hypothetical protein
MMGILREVYRNYFRYIENKVKPIDIRTPGGVRYTALALCW